jgi:N6-adenosine-specific RNA methylase IME4
MKFNVILADPPWRYDNEKSNDPRLGGFTYKSIDLEALKALEVSKVSADDCLLFLWATGPKLPEAFEVIKAWGFTYTTMAFVWVKTYKSKQPITGLGHWTRSSCEYVLLGKRGSPKRISHNVLQLLDDLYEPTFYAEATRHSVKPEEVQNRIDRLVGPDLKKLELFARRHRQGWTCTGLELDGMDVKAAIDMWSQINRQEASE